MEALYLLCSILSTFFTSIFLTLLLTLRFLLRRDQGSDSVSLYQGTVYHERRRPAHHSFSYSVRYALIDLDHALNSPPDHFTADQARRFAETSGPVFLLTIPPSVGYEQNPLSLYYCYDVGDSGNHLNKCIAEVTNTPWGERVLFLFDPKTDLVAKPLHVSPFMVVIRFRVLVLVYFTITEFYPHRITSLDMLGNWSMKANDPGDNLYVRISVQHPELGDYFVATLTAKRVSSSMSDYAIFFYLMPHKVALWIYWHALKLWWKNVKFLQHPRYINSAYRAEALVRDRKVQCCRAFRSADKVESLQGEGSYKDDLAEENFRDRQFTWRDAKWPWS